MQGKGANQTSDVLFKQLAGERLPAGQLDASSVPTEAMRIPVDMALHAMVDHSRYCKARLCQHLPPPLMPFARMRPKAILKQRDAVHKALWDCADHPFVVGIRDQVEELESASLGLEEGAEPSAEIVATALDTDDGVLRLIALIWAQGLSDEKERLFRQLVAVSAGVPRAASEGTAGSSRDKPSRKDDKKAELKAARRELRQEKKALAEAKEIVNAREHALRALNEDLAASRAALEDSEANAEQLLSERDQDRRALARQQDELEKSTRVLQQLRKENQAARTERDDAERSRTRTMSELSRVKRELARADLELKSAPSGAHAVWEFIKSENKRIDIDRTIAQGADRQRADAEHTDLRKLERAFKQAYPEFSEDRPPEPRVEKAPLTLQILGGGSEIGRSSYLLEIGERRILVDCGVKVGGEEESFAPDIDRIERLDAVVLTHAHSDHIGWLPALVRRFDDVDIYCTSATVELVPIMLEDGARHYFANNSQRRTQATYDPAAEEVIDAYEREDVETVEFRLMPCEMRQRETLPFDDFEITFFPAGHILGAASVLIEGGGRRVLASGDISSEPQLTVPAAALPTDLGQVDLLLLESTYGKGDRLREPAAKSREQLISKVGEVLGNEGSVILASFALGRAQELLTVLAEAMQRGDLPGDTPVCVDGLIRKINSIYASSDALKLPPGAFDIGGEFERRDAIHRAKSTPTIVVTTSGMLAGGPAVEYARALLGDPRHKLILTGYQDGNAPSRQLLKLASGGMSGKVVRLPGQDGTNVEFRAAAPAVQIGLSAHADQAGLLDYTSRIDADVIALVHGEPAAQEELEAQLRKRNPECRVVCGPDQLSVP